MRKMQYFFTWFLMLDNSSSLFFYISGQNHFLRKMFKNLSTENQLVN